MNWALLRTISLALICARNYTLLRMPDDWVDIRKLAAKQVIQGVSFIMEASQIA
jgi:hypothetical protein